MSNRSHLVSSPTRTHKCRSTHPYVPALHRKAMNNQWQDNQQCTAAIVLSMTIHFWLDLSLAILSPTQHKRIYCAVAPPLRSVVYCTQCHDGHAIDNLCLGAIYCPTSALLYCHGVCFGGNLYMCSVSLADKNMLIAWSYWLIINHETISGPWNKFCVWHDRSPLIPPLTSHSMCSAVAGVEVCSLS